jgi:diaminohydroxyphosphoribosylaminopyrimidine deaminase/5-amino-6-(5-phosphoribosylamino)uracil reductase
MSRPPHHPDQTWGLLDALRRAVDAKSLPAGPLCCALNQETELVPLASDQRGRAMLIRERDGTWRGGPALVDGAADVAALLGLYLPLLSTAATAGWTVAHLGQSLDGCIATRTGDSCFVTGPENILHLHRMRGLADAIIVGAGTVASDDPQLNTRLVPGPSPVRVVIDPRRRLSERFRVFQDGAAETLLCCAREHACGPAYQGQAAVMPIDGGEGGLDLVDLEAALHGRGLRRLFVEGGGVTVSRFVAAGLVDRLQITVAPVVIGQGRPGLVLAPVDAMSEALRAPAQVVPMGQDTCYELNLCPCARVMPTNSNLCRCRNRL